MSDRIKHEAISKLSMLSVMNDCTKYGAVSKLSMFRVMNDHTSHISGISKTTIIVLRVLNEPTMQVASVNYNHYFR